ncbi:DEAD/DEAH box helicase [Rhodococcus gannanensis]|uniref:DEAD/DEAH box helicase n=1 Tax=Rhodococcus gannanensis TaxID=1960308 RepID=A0ABW4P437_9NOCA
MVHAVWSSGSGVLLWVDDSADTSEWPSPLPGMLGRRFRHRATVTVPDARGELTEVTVPALALAPADAASLLLDLPAADPRLPGDLRYLIHVARGIRRWAEAGRVVPELRREDGNWWTRWRLLGGDRQRAWLAELGAAMPGVLRAAGGRQALDEFVLALTDPIVRDRLGGRDGDHPLLHALLTDTPLEVPERARVGEAESRLRRWRDSLAVEEPDLVLRLVEPDDLDGPDADVLLWRLEVCLRAAGEAPAPVRHTDPEGLRVALRLLGKAMEVYPRLRGVPSDPDGLDLLLPLAVVTDLVAHGARALAAAGVTLLLPRAWVVAAPSLRLTVASPPVLLDTDERDVGLHQLLSYNWELAIGDLVLTAAEVERLARSAADLVQLRGQWVQADAAALAKAAKYVGAHGSDGSTTLGGLLAQLTAADPPPLPVDSVTATGWVSSLLGGGARPDPVPPPAALEATLRPYQQRGLDWLAFMSGLGLGGILADDMGLGKTVQLLALLAHERERSDAAVAPTLLVCPMSVVGNWQREAARFTPGLRVHVHHGPGRLRDSAFAAAVADSDLVITTYAVATRDVELMHEKRWGRVVLDEAQHIKNAATAQSRAVRSIPARHRLALTGTPVENRLEELRSILDFANPGLLGSPQQFRARFAVPIERLQDESALARLRTVTSPFVLRRVKTDPAVIADLPEKFEMTVRANLTAEQAGLYRGVLDDMTRRLRDADNPRARKGVVLAALTRLKQVCNHPAHFLADGSPAVRRGRHRSGKLALVEDIVESVLADDERVLLFTQFREFGAIVAPYLAERFGVDVPFLHGGVSRTARDAMVRDFQDGASASPIMLLSLKAGGTGLNLTAANHVVHLDRWWNPAVENQATDRAFRIGQRRDVQVRKLLCVGTLEERIDAMLTGKAELADLAVGVGEKWITEMSDDELAALMMLGEDAVGE